MNKRDIPSVQKILVELHAQLPELPRGHAKFFIHSFLRKLKNNEFSELGIDKKDLSFSVADITNTVITYIKKQLPEQKSAINGTGIILHTGLGRSPLSSRAKQSLLTAADYNLVQANRSDGHRSLREDLIRELLYDLCSAPDTTVVNNNAAATFLMLRALTHGKEVLISRGQLVEIGGSYRMPDIMNESGCIMKEVGTTNKTHLSDYERAITAQTGAILYVHQSNFKIQGFSGHPNILELCALGKKHNIPVLADLGSGALVSLKEYGLPNEYTLKEIIHAGIHACCFSGDKLIGGSQAGIICGKKEDIERMRTDSFSRMFRVCKLTLRTIEATLLDFLDEKTRNEIPLYAFISSPVSELKARAQKIKASLHEHIQTEIISTQSYIGGGATPEEALESVGLAILCTSTLEAKNVSDTLRNSVPALFTRTHNAQVIIDFRAILPEEDEIVLSILNSFL